MNRAFVLLLALVGWAVSAFAAPESASPVGLWRIVGDKSGEAEALVQISERNGIYEGRIVTVFARPGVDPEARCELCPGARKGQAIKGLLILNGLRQNGSEYKDGEILDPDSGDIYRCSLKLSDDNRKLQVRGYLGISLFGRTQTWFRESADMHK